MRKLAAVRRQLSPTPHPSRNTMNLRAIFLALAAVASVTAANANIVTVTGTLATTDPTFNRPIEDLSDLSTVGTTVRYDVVEFTVSASSEYNFYTTASFDPFVILYAPTFAAAAPLANAVIANDDLFSQTTSGFSQALVTNTVYRYVTTGFANTDLGSYTTTISGVGTVTLVPETGTFAMLALGLALLGFARRQAQA
jgi:hypothetical protein